MANSLLHIARIKINQENIYQNNFPVLSFDFIYKISAHSIKKRTIGSALPEIYVTASVWSGCIKNTRLATKETKRFELTLKIKKYASSDAKIWNKTFVK